MTTFTTGGSAVTFTTSGSAVSFAVTAASNAFTTSAVLTPGAHASTHGAGGADPITTLGAVAHSGQQTFAAGSAAGPSIAATGDTNTGIYFPAADSVAVSTAGTARVTVASDGKVGFNEATPAATVHIATAVDGFMMDRNTDSTAPANFSFRKTRGTSSASPSAAASGDVIGRMYWKGYDGSAYQNAAYLNASIDGTVTAGTAMPGRFEFYTTPTGSVTPTERMRIDSTGLVTMNNGANIIGTATIGTAQINAGTVALSLGAAATPTLRFTGDTNTGIYSPGADQVGIATAGTARVIVDSSGNVGIGITPTTLLHAETDGNSVLKFVRNSTDTAAPLFQFFKRRGTSASPTIVANGDTIGQIDFYAYDGATNRQTAAITSNVDAAPAAGDMPSRLNFWTTPDGGVSITERMRIDNAGLITGTGTSLGQYATYTPTVGGTGWTIGNGTVTGDYCQIGKTVHFRCVITFGSTSTFGASAGLQISVPLAARAASQLKFVCNLRDASLGNEYNAISGGASTTAFVPQTIGTNGLAASVTSTVPFTWDGTSADVVRCYGTYEIA